MNEQKMKFRLDRDNYKEFFMMLAAVIMMGFSLSLLVLTHFGTDPCSSMNFGFSRLLRAAAGSNITIGSLSIPVTFGSCQLAVNLILLIFMVIFYRSVIGWGTFGNMVLVGYTADFFAWVWHNICKIPESLPFSVRVGILIPALVVFVIAAACYMHSGQGMAPYDAIPFILDDIIKKRRNNNSCFGILRFCQDFFCAAIGFFTGGEFGAITILMVLLLAPVVQYTGTVLQKLRKS